MQGPTNVKCMTIISFLMTTQRISRKSPTLFLLRCLNSVYPQTIKIINLFLTLQQNKADVTRPMLHKKDNFQITMGPEHGKV
jgi:hypothetical protein